MKSEIVGITSAVIANVQGTGFAIPINTLKILLNSLQKYGKIVRPTLGIIGVQLMIIWQVIIISLSIMEHGLSIFYQEVLLKELD